MFELVNKQGFVLGRAEYLGVIKYQPLPCTVEGYVSEQKVITTLKHSNECWMYGIVDVKDFHPFEENKTEYEWIDENGNKCVYNIITGKSNIKN